MRSKNKKDENKKFKSNSKKRQITCSQFSNKNLLENQKNSKQPSFHELKSQKLFPAKSFNVHENKIKKFSEYDLNRRTSKVAINEKDSENDLLMKENKDNDEIDEST